MTYIEELFYQSLKNRIDTAYVSITKGAKEFEEVSKDIPLAWRDELAEYAAEKGLIVLSRERYIEAMQQASGGKKKR